MIKKVSALIATFVLSMIIGVVIFFPLNAVATKVISNVIMTNGLDFRYRELDITYFGAMATGLESKDLRIDKVTLGYNPLGLLFRNIDFKATSPLFLAEGDLSGSTVTADVVASIGNIANLIKVDGSGSVNALITYNASDGNGDINITSGAITLKHPMVSLDISTFEAVGVVTSNVLTITKAEAKGNTSLTATGTVNINTTNPDMSILNISGNIGMGSINLPFTLKGVAKNARFTITN